MRLFALTAAALLGTGCFVSTNDSGSGSAVVFWNFRNWDGVVAGNFTAANSGCSTAAVTEVDLRVVRSSTGVVVDFATHPCEAGNGVPGTTVPNLRPGTYDFQVTAFRGADPVFDSVGTFTVSDGFETAVSDTLDVITPQPLSIFFSRAGVFTCAGVNSVFFSLLNAAQTVVVATDTLACTPNQEVFIPEAGTVGVNYFLDFLQLLDGGGLSTHEKCSVTVRHTGFPVVIDLPVSPDPACG